VVGSGCQVDLPSERVSSEALVVSVGGKFCTHAVPHDLLDHELGCHGEAIWKRPDVPKIDCMNPSVLIAHDMSSLVLLTGQRLVLRFFHMATIAQHTSTDYYFMLVPSRVIIASRRRSTACMSICCLVVEFT
jgi:hypothetical protein